MKTTKLILIICVAAMAVACSTRQYQLKIMSYDTNNYTGTDSLTDPQRVVDIILSENPDMVALQNVGLEDALATIAEQTSMMPSYGSSGEAGSGIGILSVNKPASMNYVSLPGGEGTFGMLVADFKKFVFASVSMSPNSADQKASVAIIKEEAAKAGKPFLLGGNLNARISSPIINSMMGDFTILTDISASTFPADNPAILVDYIMIYNHGVKNFSTIGQATLNEPVASTHRPVTTTISFR